LHLLEQIARIGCAEIHQEQSRTGLLENSVETISFSYVPNLCEDAKESLHSSHQVGILCVQDADR
jgi:hypothetical protein